MNPNTRRLWQQLGWTIIGIVICLVLLIVSLSQLQNVQTRREISTLLSDKIAGRVQQEVSSYLGRIESLLRIVEKWGQEDLQELHKPERFMAGVRPVLEEYPNIAALSLTVDGSNEISFINSSGEWSIAEQRQLKGDWFDEAQKHPGEIVWLNPERIVPLNVPALSGAVVWFNGKDSPRGGAVAQMPIRQFYDFIARLEPSPGGRVYLIDSAGDTLIRSGIGTAHDQLFEASDDPVLQAAVASGINTVPFDNPPQLVTAEKRNWWASVRPLNPRNPVSRLVILIPEEEIIGAISGQRYALPIIAGILVLVGLVVIIWQLKRYRLHLAERAPWLASTKVLQTDLDERIQLGENAHQEFKSTIRKNLRSGKFGKEIEKAWLKGVVAFLNTEGGLLFFGIDDDGNALGLEADEFQSDDHCNRHVKSLISQHIGADFTAFTHFELLNYQGKTVGLLACRPSPEPAFLSIGQEEEFYIRNGPASLALSISQTLAYLKKRR